MTALDRRALFHRALTVAAAASVGTVTNLPAAVGSASQHDPVLPLVDEYFRLVDEVNQGGERSHQAFEEEEAIGERIYDAVATTAAGILAQLRLLRECAETGSGWTDDRDMRLFDSITAGIERLVPGGVA